MAGFIQFVEFEAKDVDAVAAALERFRDEKPGAVLSSPATIAEDRERPGTYVSIVQFDSYEQAMTQSQNPAVDGFSRARAASVPQPRRAGRAHEPIARRRRSNAAGIWANWSGTQRRRTRVHWYSLVEPVVSLPSRCHWLHVGQPLPQARKPELYRPLQQCGANE